MTQYSRVYETTLAKELNTLYPFVYRALLTEESLDKAGRQVKRNFGAKELTVVKEKLSYDMLEEEALNDANRMAVVYSAIHAFENMVRDFVKTSMIDEFQEDWWESVPDRIKKKVAGRMDEDAKFKWHGTRGGSELDYCDFGDLSSIIVTNWGVFEIALSDSEWTKSILGVLERSRNIVMHGGVLAIQDIERIGGNIRDWVRQTG